MSGQQDPSAENITKTSPKPLKPTGPNRSRLQAFTGISPPRMAQGHREDKTSTEGELAPGV